MKNVLLFVLLFCAVFDVSTTQAQCRKPRFRPDWTFEVPRPTNATYIFDKQQGEGTTRREALNQAMARVFEYTANRIGQFVSTEEIHRAVQTGEDFDVIGRNMKIPIYKVCEFFVQDTINYRWTAYVLCQVAKAGNITPQFETFTECGKHEKYDEFKKHYDECLKKIEDDKRMKAYVELLECKKAKRKENAKAFCASFFVPGVGQMMKGYGTEGAFTLIGDLGLIGGGVGTYFVAKKQLDLLKSGTLDIETFNVTKTKYNALRITTYSMFAAAGALYVFNLYRACAAKSKKHQYYCFYPTVIPSENDLALGVGMSINF